MPDLVRVPSHAANDHAGQYLFFSKDRIEALIGDHSLFRSSRDGHDVPKGPSMHVIAIDLGSMLIPFEVLVAPVEQSFRHELADQHLVVNEALTTLSDLQALQSAPDPEARSYRGVNLAAIALSSDDTKSLTQLTTAVAAACASHTPADDSDKCAETQTEVSGQLTTLEELVNGRNLKQFPTMLLNDPAYGLDAITGIRDQLDIMTKAALAGSPPKTGDQALEKIQERLKAFNARVYYYDILALGLRELLSTQLGDTTPAAKDLAAINSHLEALLKTLENINPYANSS